MVADWIFRVLLAIPLQIVARLAAPFALISRDKTRAPAWAWWIAAVDHDIAGPGADPMWRRWWETDEGGGRAWYCVLGRKLGIRSTLHGLPRLMQLLRNAGAGAMYRGLGLRVDELLIVQADASTRLAYRLKDTAGVGGGRTPIPGAKPVAFYKSIAWPGGWHSQLGWKLNHPVLIGDRTYCKLSFSPLRK